MYAHFRQTSESHFMTSEGSYLVYKPFAFVILPTSKSQILYRINPKDAVHPIQILCLTYIQS